MWTSGAEPTVGVEQALDSEDRERDVQTSEAHCPAAPGLMSKCASTLGPRSATAVDLVARTPSQQEQPGTFAADRNSGPYHLGPQMLATWHRKPRIPAALAKDRNDPD
eukprot:10608648-Alexandrium_andersonii.AAC.1